jgi:DNA mismatch repair protein MutS
MARHPQDSCTSVLQWPLHSLLAYSFSLTTLLGVRLFQELQAIMSTPARRQYLEIKAQYPDTLLAYQVGDFFEFFDDDARTVSHELQLVLTGRSYGPGEQVPLAGVPLHALETYLTRLVARGYRVAICEQVSPPGRGLVQRKVTRILTPGTVVEPGMLPAARDNFLAATAFTQHTSARGCPFVAGLAYVEASTGAFACTQWAAEQLPDGLQAELERLGAAEVLVAEQVLAQRADLLGESASWLLSLAPRGCPDHYFDSESAHARLCQHFATSTLVAFGCEGQHLAVAAAGAILAYLERMNPALLPLLTNLMYYDTSGQVEVDGRTWRALEVIEPARPAPTQLGQASSARGVTLLGTLDATHTPMGARLLRRTLLQPLHSRPVLEERLDAISEMVEHPNLRQHLAAALDGLGDIERLIARIVHGTAVPREIYALAAGLTRVPGVIAILRRCEAPGWRRLCQMLDPCPEVRQLIETAIADPRAASGRLVRPGYSGELDDLTATITEARQWIAELEVTERERTGIKSLKVGFNSVFGYYIEVSRPNLSRAPAEYIRKQTMATGERFVTAELKEHEALVLQTQERIEALERALYGQVLRDLAAHQNRVRATAQALAQADVWLGLADVAVARRYTRPELCDEPVLEIAEGRHPIVETALENAEFIPNDAQLHAAEQEDERPQIMLLTGPNMAGKSTYLRQVASIALLAHVGSFVPAGRARVGLVDRIFTRAGAEDDLARGLSTFMLEMVETAYILRHATRHSLVILDEVGRGTSTSDGLALARAIMEYLHDHSGARTLFATHYHELAGLSQSLPRIGVFRMAIAEREGQAVFLHRVVPGASDNSYGVQVARMAGLPGTVTARAAELLVRNDGARPFRVAEGAAEYTLQATPQPPVSEADHHKHEIEPVEGHPQRELALALASLNIASMTPIEAINVLFSLQQRALQTLQDRVTEGA